MDLTAAGALALSLMDQHGLRSRGWKFVWDGAKRRMGLCTYATKTISVSRFYAAEASEGEIRDTVLHEIAHAIAGPAARHGAEWKSHARRIGATPKSCGPNPYASRIRDEKVDAAIAAAHSLGTIPGSAGLPAAVRHGQPLSLGERVVHLHGAWAGRVFVIVEKRRTNYLAVVESTRKTVLIREGDYRRHVEGEDLLRAARDYVTPSGEVIPAKDQEATGPKAQILPWTPPTPRAQVTQNPIGGLRAGDEAVILYPGSSYNGTVVRVSRVNGKSCSVVVIESKKLRAGESMRVSHSLLTKRAAQAAQAVR